MCWTSAVLQDKASSLYSLGRSRECFGNNRMHASETGSQNQRRRTLCARAIFINKLVDLLCCDSLQAAFPASARRTRKPDSEVYPCASPRHVLVLVLVLSYHCNHSIFSTTVRKLSLPNLCYTTSSCSEIAGPRSPARALSLIRKVEKALFYFLLPERQLSDSL